MTKYNFREETVKNQKATHAIATYSTFSADYSGATWSIVLHTAALYLLSQIVRPLMVIASKLLKRDVRFFPVHFYNIETTVVYPEDRRGK
jgi:hypothetical protein